MMLAGAVPLDAQQGYGILSVQVRAFPGGKPLAGAQIIVEGVGIGGITDQDGRARLFGLQPGSRSVQVRYLGYGTQSSTVLLRPHQTTQLRFDLRVQPIQLAEVKAKARPSDLHAQGFYNRKVASGGTFITREDIERMRPAILSDVFRRTAGIVVAPPGNAGYSAARFRGTNFRYCPIQFYVDGTMTNFFNIDLVRPQDVEGLEIYRGAATVPPQYNRGTAGCGVVVIWTKKR